MLDVAGNLILSKITPDTTGIPAGNEILLSGSVTDQFSNVVSGDTIRFIVRAGGGNLNSQDSVDVVTDASVWRRSPL